jgi:phage gp16-like protein
MTADPDNRRRELAQIHIAKKQLGIEDDAYRDMLRTIGRVESSADLGDHGRKAVLEHLKKCGFQASRSTKPKLSSKPGAWDWVNNAAPERQAMLRKIAVMLKDADREKHYADGIAKNMFHVERIEFCQPAQLHSIVAAMVRDHARRAARSAA